MPPGPERRRHQEKYGDRSPLLARRSSSCTMRKTPRRGRGLPWQSRRDLRHGSSDACSWCRSSMFQCCIRWTRWWASRISSTLSLPVLAVQVVEVPKLTLQDRIPQRTVLRGSQMAEQLVEVQPVSPLFCDIVPQMETEMVEVPIVLAQSELQQLYEHFSSGWWEVGIGSSSRRYLRTEFNSSWMVGWRRYDYWYDYDYYCYVHSWYDYDCWYVFSRPFPQTKFNSAPWSTACTFSRFSLRTGYNSASSARLRSFPT